MNYWFSDTHAFSERHSAITALFSSSTSRRPAPANLLCVWFPTTTTFPFFKNIPNMSCLLFSFIIKVDPCQEGGCGEWDLKEITFERETMALFGQGNYILFGSKSQLPCVSGSSCCQRWMQQFCLAPSASHFLECLQQWQKPAHSGERTQGRRKWQRLSKSARAFFWAAPTWRELQVMPQDRWFIPVSFLACPTCRHSLWVDKRKQSLRM